MNQVQPSILHQEFDVLIERLVIGGDGLTRVNGKVCFVPLGVPQDHLCIQITEDKKDFSRGEILKILKPSPLRREAPCPYFGKCGGCSWQHLPVKEQESIKSEMVLELLSKKLKKTFNFLNLVSSPQEFFYRNRITLKYDGQNLGYFQRRSHELVPIDRCLLADENLNQSLDEIKAKLANETKKNKKYPDQTSSVQIYLKDDLSVSYRTQESTDDLLGFSQVNEQQNQNLIKTVCSWAGEEKYTAFYDFYSGSGNFTFPIYDLQKNIPTIAVEADASLTERGYRLRGARTKIRFFTTRVEKFLESQDFHPDSLILIDPPRGGCEASVIRALAHSRAKKIIYISCHPASLARDLSWFFEEDKNEAYVLDRVQCFDMFPQTDHIETVAEIRRR